MIFVFFVFSCLKTNLPPILHSSYFTTEEDLTKLIDLTIESINVNDFKSYNTYLIKSLKQEKAISFKYSTIRNIIKSILLTKIHSNSSSELVESVIKDIILKQDEINESIKLLKYEFKEESWKNKFISAKQIINISYKIVCLFLLWQIFCNQKKICGQEKKSNNTINQIYELLSVIKTEFADQRQTMIITNQESIETSQKTILSEIQEINRLVKSLRDNHDLSKDHIETIRITLNSIKACLREIQAQTLPCNELIANKERTDQILTNLASIETEINSLINKVQELSKNYEQDSAPISTAFSELHTSISSMASYFRRDKKEDGFSLNQKSHHLQ